jgi:hypothetical protein
MKIDDSIIQKRTVMAQMEPLSLDISDGLATKEVSF